MRPLEKDTPMFEFFSLITNEIYTIVLYAWMLFGNDAPSTEALTVACPDPLTTFEDIRSCFDRVALMNS